jgi:hypothetical protein
LYDIRYEAYRIGRNWPCRPLRRFVRDRTSGDCAIGIRGPAVADGAAAAQGYPDASYGIARMYEYGLGVPVNLSEAVIWYGKAGAPGDPRAAERRRNLSALYLTFDDTFGGRTDSSQTNARRTSVQ